MKTVINGFESLEVGLKEDGYITLVQQAMEGTMIIVFPCSIANAVIRAIKDAKRNACPTKREDV